MNHALSSVASVRRSAIRVAETVGVVDSPSLLDEFILANLATLIASTRERVTLRSSPRPVGAEESGGVPIFLEQLVVALRLARSTPAVDHEEIRRSARQHGRDLLGLGISIAQVVHAYGDVSQAVSELAVERGAPIEADEFNTMNLCIDNAIAAAVSEYSRKSEATITGKGTERLGILAHELRNLLNVATLSFENISSGRVAVGGSTGLLHARSLVGLSQLIDRSLADVRLDAGISPGETITVASLLEEVEIGAMLQAQEKGVHLVISRVRQDVQIVGDRQILTAALANLLQNAFKFGRANGTVTLETIANEERVLFEVEDECGGLPPGTLEGMFRPFEQRSTDRSGVGLGLTIARKAAEANGGEVRVRDLPGKGCVFTLDLPRKHVE